MSQTIYAYQDVDRNNVMLAARALNFTGTWSLSGTYASDTKDVVDYGAGQFIAIVDNVGVVPTQAPRRNQTAKWSSLVVFSNGTTDSGHTADEAYNVASEALESKGTCPLSHRTDQFTLTPRLPVRRSHPAAQILPLISSGRAPITPTCACRPRPMPE